MSTSDIKITITATNNASKAFDDVTTAAEKLGPALDTATTSASSLKPAIDDAVGAVSPIKPAVDDAVTALTPLPGKIDDLTTSATSAKAPLDDAATGTSGLGTAISDAGKTIPGAAGDIVTSLGDMVTASKESGTSFSAAQGAMILLSGAAVGVAAVLGPVAIGAALSLASAGVSKLAGLLSGGDGLADHLDETRASAAKLNDEILKTASGMEDAASALVLFKGGSAIDTMITDFARLIELQKVFTGGNPAGDFAGGAVPGIENYNQAMGEAISLTGKYGIATRDLTSGNVDLTGQLSELTQVQQLYNDLIKVTGPGQDEVRSRLTELVGQYQNGTISLDELNNQLTWMNENLQTAYVAPAIAAAALAQFSKAAYDAAVNVGLLNSDVEKLAAAGVHTAAIDVAVNLDGSQLENVFNIIVGGTEKLGQSSQAVADWSAGLLDATDGASKLDRVLSSGLITQNEYNGAIDANTKIQAANVRIQDDLVAIQAKQAPLLAELAEQQAAYIDSLAGLPAQQQLVALGYMDTAESAKAMTLAQLAANAAAGELGDTGEATATKIITAAAQADPVMKAMLEDMGLISEGADGTITVNFPESTSINDAIKELYSSIDALTLAIGGVPPVHTETNAADTQIGVDNLHGAIDGLPDSHNTDINATDNASGVIGGVSQALDQINGKTANTYLNNYVTTFTTAVTSVSPGTGTGGGGAPIGGRNGGVIGMANGGFVTAELAENGAELLRFRDGGETIVPRRGLYAVPVGASVLPAEATKATLRERGGGDVYIDMRGASITIEATDGDVAETWRSWAINQARTG
jgi:hypothetical protein